MSLYHSKDDYWQQLFVIIIYLTFNNGTVSDIVDVCSGQLLCSSVNPSDPVIMVRRWQTWRNQRQIRHNESTNNIIKLQNLSQRQTATE